MHVGNGCGTFNRIALAFIRLVVVRARTVKPVSAIEDNVEAVNS
jgi:hypothetical protein